MSRPNGTFLAGHFIESDTYATRRPQGMDDYLIAYTLEGCGEFTVGGEKRICRAGDLVLLDGTEPHAYKTPAGETWEFYWAHFPANLSETHYLPPDQTLVICKMVSKHVQERIIHAFRRLIRDSREQRELWQDLCSVSVKEILLLLARRFHTRMDPRVEQVLHLMSARMNEPLRIDDLGRAVGLSPSRLSHLFKEKTGRTLIDTLNRMRLHQAFLLLQNTDMTAAEVALTVGFQNYNHFATLFRRQFGASPRHVQR